MYIYTHSRLYIPIRFGDSFTARIPTRTRPSRAVVNSHFIVNSHFVVNSTCKCLFMCMYVCMYVFV